MIAWLLASMNLAAQFIVGLFLIGLAMLLAIWVAAILVALVIGIVRWFRGDTQQHNNGDRHNGKSNST